MLCKNIGSPQKETILSSNQQIFRCELLVSGSISYNNHKKAHVFFSCAFFFSNVFFLPLKREDLHGFSAYDPGVVLAAPPLPGTLDF